MEDMPRLLQQGDADHADRCMIPEAFEHGGMFTGLFTVMGFLFAASYQSRNKVIYKKELIMIPTSRVAI